jgi:hypothetical protein
MTRGATESLRAGRSLRGLGAVGIAGLALLWALALAGPAAGAGTCATGMQAQAFSSSGEQCYTVPVGVTQVQVAAVGAPGQSVGSATGGAGATASAVLPVSSGQTLYVEVGGTGNSGSAGFNGGAAAGGAGGGAGGGASDVRTCSTTANGSSCTVASALLVAAGGGGSGGEGTSNTNGPGVAAGGSAGASPQPGMGGSDYGGVGGNGGGPGSATAGGAVGTGGSGSPTNGGNGAIGQEGVGGAGGGGGAGIPDASGGGGGGGLYGGGGGGGGGYAQNTTESGGGGGGGAGSSFIESSGTNGSVGTAAGGSSASVTITAIAPAPAPAPTTPTGSNPSGSGVPSGQPALGKGAGIAGRTVTERGGQVTLTIVNPNSVAAHGTVTLTALLARVSAARLAKNVIGSTSFSVPAGRRVKVKLTLSKKARTYLGKHKRLPAKAAVILRAARTSKASTTTIVIKAPARRP